MIDPKPLPQITLYPYQLEGVQFLTERKHAILADEMGLGKSPQALIAAWEINAKTILILCPAVARSAWVQQVAKFTTRWIPKTTPVFSRKQAQELQTTPHGRVAVVSYDLAHHIPSSLKFDLLILDECHFLKSAKAKRTKTVFARGGLIHRAARTWALSGTPAPNHPGELWPILKTFGVVTEPYFDFVKKYCQYYVVKPSMKPFIPPVIQITGARAEGIYDLKSRLKPHLLRRQTNEVLKDMPPINHHTVNVDVSSRLSPKLPTELKEKLKSEMDSVAKELYNQSLTGDAGVDPDIFFDLLSANAQAIATLRRYTGIQKSLPVAELIHQELSANAYPKIVIFAVHRDVVATLEEQLHEFHPLVITGSTPAKTRGHYVDRFQNNPEARVFIGNIQAAGTAITLTAANQVAFVELSYVPGENAQALKRCHRIGQDKPVFARTFTCDAFLDGQILSALKRKTDELFELFDSPRDVPKKVFDEFTKIF